MSYLEKLKKEIEETMASSGDRQTKKRKIAKIVNSADGKFNSDTSFINSRFRAVQYCLSLSAGLQESPVGKQPATPIEVAALHSTMRRRQ